MIREAAYYFPDIFHSGAETRFSHSLGRRRSLDNGWLYWFHARPPQKAQKPRRQPKTVPYGMERSTAFHRLRNLSVPFRLSPRWQGASFLNGFPSGEVAPRSDREKCFRS